MRARPPEKRKPSCCLRARLRGWAQLLAAPVLHALCARRAACSHTRHAHDCWPIQSGPSAYCLCLLGCGFLVRANVSAEALSALGYSMLCGILYAGAVMGAALPCKRRAAFATDKGMGGCEDVLLAKAGGVRHRFRGARHSGADAVRGGGGRACVARAHNHTLRRPASK